MAKLTEIIKPTKRFHFVYSSSLQSWILIHVPTGLGWTMPDILKLQQWAQKQFWTNNF